MREPVKNKIPAIFHCECDNCEHEQDIYFQHEEHAPQWCECWKCRKGKMNRKGRVL